MIFGFRSKYNSQIRNIVLAKRIYRDLMCLTDSAKKHRRGHFGFDKKKIGETFIWVLLFRCCLSFDQDFTKQFFESF